MGRDESHSVSLALVREIFRQRLELEFDAGELLANTIVQVLSDSPPFHLADLQHLLLQALVFGNVSANRNILLRFTIGIQIRINGCCDPVKLPVLGTIAPCQTLPRAMVVQRFLKNSFG